MKRNFRLNAISASIALLCSLVIPGCGQQHQADGAPLQSVQAITAKADSGDANAQIELAKRYASGDGVDLNQEAAFSWFKKAAEQNNLPAMIELAKIYYKGAGVTEDDGLSQMWWRKAAEAGSAEAQYEMSLMYGNVLRSSVFIPGKGQLQEENAANFIGWLSKSASQNYPEAEFELGMTYLLGATNGEGAKQKILIPKDLDKGLLLLQKSAKQGYYKSQWALAVLYQSGYSRIEPDKSESDKYWTMLEGQNDSDAENQIGFLYREKNREKYVDGKNKYKGVNLNFDETNSVALMWFQKSAAQGNKYALYNVGSYFFDGEGVAKDPSKAIEYLKKAAEAGNYGAMFKLFSAYFKGIGTVKDYGEAYRWVIQVANQDVRRNQSRVHQARHIVGLLHEVGLGVDQDLVLAYAWHNIALSGGYTDAKDELAYIEKKLTQEQLREAQTLSREWKPGKTIVRVKSLSPEPIGPSTKNGEPKLSAVGTAFYISSTGELLTNNHVVAGCKELKIPLDNASAKLFVADKANDLAVLKQETTGKNFLKLSKDGAKQGEEIFVFGYPLDGYLPTSGNITTGIVSALAGPSNNTSLFQITAPIQPGNSGGPVLDKKGNVVGVVVGKADAIKVARVTGDIPQNVNFAISDKTATSFMDVNNVSYQTSSRWMAFSKDSISISEIARKATVKVECWK